LVDRAATVVFADAKHVGGPAASAPLPILVVRQTAREIEERLLDGPSVHERALQKAFLRARRRARGPLILVSEDTLMCNAGAARLFDEADRPQLWAAASSAVNSRVALAAAVTSRTQDAPPPAPHAFN
jgi:hypothetical protein